MGSHDPKYAFEKKVTAAIEGYRSNFEPTAALRFRSESLTAEQAVLRLHETIDLNEEVRVTKAKYDAALEACTRRLPVCRAFYEEAIGVARSHHGSDPKKMASFGVTGSRKACPPSGTRKPTREPEPSCRGGEASSSDSPETVIVVEETTTQVGAPPCEAPPSCEKPPKRGSRGRGRRCPRGQS